MTPRHSLDNSEMSGNYTGPLNSLRRPELQKLIQDMDITGLPNRYLSKYELVELVRAELKSSPSKRRDERFIDLWSHMPESRMNQRELARLVQENGVIEDPLLKAGEEHVVDQSAFDHHQHKSLEELYNPERSASVERGGGGGQGESSRSESRSRSQSQAPFENDGSVLPSLREAMMHPHIFETLLNSHPVEGAQEILHTAIDHAQNGFEQAVEQYDNLAEQNQLALVPTSRSLRRKASRSLQLVTKKSGHNLRVVARGSVAVVAEAQWRLSSSWILILGILATEFLWIGYEALPWIEYTFGPYPSLFLPDIPYISLQIPALHLLLHPLFTLALLRYSFQTLLIPLLISLIFAFPSQTSSSSSSSEDQPRRRQRKRLNPPSPLIFTLTRLSIALLNGYLLPSSQSPTQQIHEIASHSRLALSKTLRNILHEASVTGLAPGLTGYASWGWRETIGGIAGRGGGERKWAVEQAVEGLWGVVGLGMGVGAVVSAVESRR